MKGETRENPAPCSSLPQRVYVVLADAYQVNVNGHGFNNTNNLKQVICSLALGFCPSSVDQDVTVCQRVGVVFSHSHKILLRLPPMQGKKNSLSFQGFKLQAMIITPKFRLTFHSTSRANEDSRGLVYEDMQFLRSFLGIVSAISPAASSHCKASDTTVLAGNYFTA